MALTHLFSSKPNTISLGRIWKSGSIKVCFNTWQNEWCARSSVSPHGHMAGGKFRNAHQHGKPGNPHQQSTIVMNWITLFYSPRKIDMIEVFLSFCGHDGSRTGEEKLQISLFFCALPSVQQLRYSTFCLTRLRVPLPPSRGDTFVPPAICCLHLAGRWAEQQ